MIESSVLRGPARLLFAPTWGRPIGSIVGQRTNIYSPKSPIVDLYSGLRGRRDCSPSRLVQRCATPTATRPRFTRSKSIAATSEPERVRGDEGILVVVVVAAARQVPQGGGLSRSHVQPRRPTPGAVNTRLLNAVGCKLPPPAATTATPTQIPVRHP